MAEEPVEEFLEGDNPIPGQNYVCMSFLSPETCIKSKEIYMFQRYMTQKYGEYEQAIDKAMENASDELKNKIEKDLKEKLRLELRYTYDQFKSNYDDFLYKFNDELEKEFNEKNEYRTSIRGVKVRGVYETMREAEIKAKQLQKRDRSFHVFIGSMGQWLPWDPNADRVQNEEYLEDELNTLMKEYKKNEANKDIFYEEQKRERKNAAEQDRLKNKELEKQELENKKNMEKIEEHLETDDPWMERQKSISGEAESNESTESTESAEAPPS